MATANCAEAPAIEISFDRLTATLKVCAEDGPGHTPNDVISRLRDLGVTTYDPNSIEALAGPDGQIKLSQDVVLAHGKPPVPAQPARREMLVQPPDAKASSSHYDRCAYLTAKPGQAIAKIYPPVPGQDGVDVLGKPLIHPKPRSTAFVLGENVQFDKDGITVLATAVGRICQNANKLWVATVAEIPGDVDFSCGNIDVSGDVEIRGSVLDLFKVKGLNIHVGGAIEGAQINAVQDLTVDGGIVGKDKGHCAAGANIACKYATNVTLVAGGNIHTRGEIAHSRIICAGRLTLDQGPLTSGHVTANGGVACHSLGSPAGSKVLVEAGFDETLRAAHGARIHEAQIRKQKASHIRTTVNQILRGPHAVNASQRERAAVLLREADESEKACDEMLRPLREACAASRQLCHAEIVVHDVLHAGATVRFPNVEATIETDWKGPLQLVPRQQKEGWELLLIDIESKSSQSLPCRPWHDAIVDAIQREITA